MLVMVSPAKKRKTPFVIGESNIKKIKSSDDRSTLHEEINYAPLDLKELLTRITQLCHRVPVVPTGGFPTVHKKSESISTTNSTNASTLPTSSVPCPYDKNELRAWATSLQTVLEEFHLLVACVSPACYVWGTDRSGAANQNLNVLSNELLSSQEQILARVSPRLNDVLAPVVTLLTDKTITKKLPDGSEVKQNYFVTTHEDPDYVDLCYTILARNAHLLRQVVLANFDKLLQLIHDYLQAQHKDSQHDARGFVY